MATGRLVIRSKRADKKIMTGHDVELKLVDDNGNEHTIPARSLMISVGSPTGRVRAVIDVDASNLEIDGVVDLALRKTVTGDIDDRFDDGKTPDA